MPRDIEEICRDIEETRERLQGTAAALGWKLDLPSRARDTARETVRVIRDRVASESGRDTGPSQGPSATRERVHDATQAVSDRVDDAKGALGSAADAVSDGVAGARDHMSSAAGAVADKLGGAREKAGSAAEGVGERVHATADGAKAAGGAVARTGRRVADGSRPAQLLVGALVLGVAAGLAAPATGRERQVAGAAVDELRERAEEAGHAVVDRGEAVAEQALETARP